MNTLAEFVELLELLGRELHGGSSAVIPGGSRKQEPAIHGPARSGDLFRPAASANSPQGATERRTTLSRRERGKGEGIRPRDRRLRRQWRSPLTRSALSRRLDLSLRERSGARDPPVASSAALPLDLHVRRLHDLAPFFDLVHDEAVEALRI